MTTDDGPWVATYESVHDRLTDLIATGPESQRRFHQVNLEALELHATAHIHRYDGHKLVGIEFEVDPPELEDKLFGVVLHQYDEDGRER